MDRVQELLNELHQAAARGGVDRLPSYEAPIDNYEVAAFESYLKSQGYDSFTAREVAMQARNKPAIGQQIKQAMQSGNGLVALSSQTVPGNIVSAANFSITVKRLTNDLNVSLPYAMFGFQDSKQGYRNLLNGLLPPGITLTAFEVGETSGKPDSATFEYTDGVDIDIVEITSNTYPYPSLLEASASDLMQMSKIRLELSDSTQQGQFRQEIRTDGTSPFGKGNYNKITPTAFRSPEQFQAGIVDLDAIFKIDKETALISKILPVAGFEVTYNSFVERFMRPIAKGW